MESDCTGGRIAMQFDTASQNKRVLWKRRIEIESYLYCMLQ